jgi:hypothetical protein
MLQLANPSNLPPYEWIFQHLQVIGWPTLCYAVWRVTRFFTLVEGRVLNAEEHLMKMSTNCFPTMQSSLQNQDGLLQSMDKSLRTLANGRISDDRTPRPLRKKK